MEADTLSLINVNRMLREHRWQEEIVGLQVLSGTTEGKAYLLESERGARYILKYDGSDYVRRVVDFLELYRESALLPKVVLDASSDHFFLYTYCPGTTHYNRGSKKEWMASLVTELLNRYARCAEGEDGRWGRYDSPRRSWHEFVATSVEYVRSEIGNVLADEDHELIGSLVRRHAELDFGSESRYRLHGDTGVHNFVFERSALAGVIDPDPMIGPALYDFAYAYCSSPDDLDRATLMSAYELLSNGRMNETVMLLETTIQLYCRIGICLRHHPHDLADYLLAWPQWKEIGRELLR